MVIAGKGKWAVFSILNVVPCGFSIYLVKHLIVCHITKAKHEIAIKKENNENMAFLLETTFFLGFFMLTIMELNKYCGNGLICNLSSYFITKGLRPKLNYYLSTIWNRWTRTYILGPGHSCLESTFFIKTRFLDIFSKILLPKKIFIFKMRT